MIVQVNPNTDFKPIINGLEETDGNSNSPWRDLAWKLFAANQNWRLRTIRTLETRLRNILLLLQLRDVDKAYRQGLADGYARARRESGVDDEEDDDLDLLDDDDYEDDEDD